METEPELSEQTKAEQALGKKMLAENAAKIDAAAKQREAEAEVAKPVDEAQKAADEAKPLPKGKKPVFPVAS